VKVNQLKQITALVAISVGQGDLGDYRSSEYNRVFRFWLEKRFSQFSVAWKAALQKCIKSHNFTLENISNVIFSMAIVQEESNMAL